MFDSIRQFLARTREEIDLEVEAHLAGMKEEVPERRINRVQTGPKHARRKWRQVDRLTDL